MKWAVRYGIRASVADAINRLIDKPESFGRLPWWRVGSALSYLGHDHQRGKKWSMATGVSIAHQLYGYEGVLAYYLHHCLDYVEAVTNPSRVVAMRRLAMVSRATKGIDRWQRREIMVRVLTGVRVRPGFTRRDLLRDPEALEAARRMFHRWAERLEVPEDLVRFVDAHFREIIADIAEEDLKRGRRARGPRWKSAK